MRVMFKFSVLSLSVLLFAGCVVHDHPSRMASAYSSSYQSDVLSGYNSDYNKRPAQQASGYSSSKTPAVRNYPGVQSSVNSGYSSSAASASNG